MQVIYFGSIGGKNVKRATDRILDRVFKKAVATKYSRTGKSARGRPAKLSFKRTPMFPIIFRKIMLNYNIYGM